MISPLNDKCVTVAGLGRFGGGITVARWLVEQGAKVLVTDQAKADAMADSVEKLRDLPIEFRLGQHLEEDFTQADLIVASPAVPPNSRYLQAAHRAGVPVTTEVRLFIERCPAPIVGVTGTKGKSTATAMLGAILRRRYTAHVGGNLGGSLLFDLPKIQADHVVVLELSSFMLEYLAEARWSPNVAVITMIAADHLDRHGTKSAYVEAKKNIVRFQKPSDIAVLNEDCPDCQAFAHATAGRVMLFGLQNRRPFQLLVPGRHNQLNAQAAFAAAGIFGLSWDNAQAALRNFKGLPHRLELVAERNGVRFYNDSIATIPEAAIAALESFAPRTVIQIVGGYDKKLPMDSMCAALVNRAKAVMCIGHTGPAMAQAMGEASRIGSAPAYQCGDLQTAFRMARKVAASGDIVLLSTGCASYDQFPNFEERGEAFRRLVLEDSDNMLSASSHPIAGAPIPPA